MLYLTPTPIGNLEDITLRALRVLKEVDYILAEDTRVSKQLLQHFSIDTPLYSFHQFNEKEKENSILNDLREGKNIALISDAGTPTINDPGQRLTKRCQEENLSYTALPGPCAVINSIVLSAESSNAFQFLGFFPKKGGKSVANQALRYPGTTVFYLSPHNALKCLENFPKGAHLSICREMTKTYEEVLTGSAERLLTHFEEHPPRGEMVLLVRSEVTLFPLAYPEVVELLCKHLPQAKAERLAKKISGA